MLKDTRLSFKIGGGYALLIILTLALGILGVLSMRDVEEKSQLLSSAYVPEVSLANEIERTALLMMYSMRGYSLSRNEAQLEEAQMYLDKANELLPQAVELANSHKELKQLATTIEELQSKFTDYQKLVDDTVTLNNAISEARKDMGTQAVSFSMEIRSLQISQGASFARDIEERVSSVKLKQHLDKNNIFTDIMALGDEIRINSLTAYSERNPELFKKPLESFERLEKLFGLVGKLVTSQIDLQSLETAHKAALAYKESVIILAESIDKIRGIGAAGAKTTQDILSIVKTISEAGLQNTANIANEATTSLATAVNTLLIGLAFAVILAAFIAVIITRNITGPLGRVVGFADNVATGDLNSTLTEERGDELGQLATSIRSMVTSLKERMDEAAYISEEADRAAKAADEARITAEEAGQRAEAGRQAIHKAAAELQSVIEVVTSASEQLSAQVEQSSRGAELQTQRSSEAATAMEQMTASVMEVANNAASAAQATGNTREKAQNGAQIVQQAVTQIDEVQKQSLVMKQNMSELDNQAESIGAIMNVISDIADQTNLLALNAAIEAARAGEAGRGFAVVADEVRKLAEKTMTATKEVGDAIRGIQDGTRETVHNVERSVTTIAEATKLVTDSGKSLHEIVTFVEDVNDQVQTIATAAEEQSAASEEISRSVEEVSSISSETSQAMGQAAKAVTELSNQAMNLKALIDRMVSGEE